MEENNSKMQHLIPVLKDVTIFSGFSDSEIEKTFRNCEILESKTGDILLRENTPATEIMIILKGKVTLVLNLEEDPLELMEFGPGSCIGETAVIGIQDHSASAVVMEDAVLLVLSRKVLMELFERDKSLFSMLILNIARELARRLYHTNEILLHYGQIEKKRHPYVTTNLKVDL